MHITQKTVDAKFGKHFQQNVFILIPRCFFCEQTNVRENIG